MLKNTPHNYGLVAILVHWIAAVAIIGLFILGTWMIDLDYYHAWYQAGPDIHRSVGLLLLPILGLRVGWRFFNSPPLPEPNIRRWEQRTAVAVHWLLNFLTLVIIVTGYLISSADGRGVGVFDWFEIPATITSIDRQEEVAGKLHYYFAVTILVLAALHALAALKHHFIDHDATLKKMVGMK